MCYFGNFWLNKRTFCFLSLFLPSSSFSIFSVNFMVSEPRFAEKSSWFLLFFFFFLKEMDSGIFPNFVPDYNHELFLGHSDNTNHSLSTKHLNDLNFEQWECSVQISLVAKNKMGFVDGSCRKPANPQMAKQWERCDKMVISWLLHSCEENISSSVLYCNSAADI